MRDRIEYAGQTVKIKNKVGSNLQGEDMSGKEFVIQDWAENVFGCSWINAIGLQMVMEYYIRVLFSRENNGVPLFNDDVVYGKVDGADCLFHVKELELPAAE